MPREAIYPALRGPVCLLFPFSGLYLGQPETLNRTDGIPKAIRPPQVNQRSRYAKIKPDLVSKLSLPTYDARGRAQETATDLHPPVHLSRSRHCTVGRHAKNDEIRAEKRKKNDHSQFELQLA